MTYSNSKRNLIRAILFSLAVAFLSCICFSGCTKKAGLKAGLKAGQSETKKSGKLNITATFYPLYIMLMNITDGIPDIELSMLAPPNTGCLHDYQLTTADMRTIDSCDILVANGAGMEDFLDKVLESKHNRTIVAADGYKLVDGNSHIWVSPAGAIYEVKKIASGLAVLDSAHAKQYAANASRYTDELEALRAKMHSTLDVFKGTKIITFHESFPYFASEFNLETAAVIEREPGTEPSPRELSDIVDIIKKTESAGNRVALFAEPQYSSSAADVIASETGCTVYELDPAVTGKIAKNAYFTAMEQNCTVLQTALTQANPVKKEVIIKNATGGKN